MTVSSLTITSEAIHRIIQSLDKNKAHGWDNISIHMIKLCGDSLCIPLKLIFDTCLSTGTYPAVWKRSNVTPIHKKGSKNQIGHYRPISLLLVLSKI